MKIEDNIIKAALKNVYFINGTAFGGKSTIADAVSKKLNVDIYHLDDNFDNFSRIANSNFQPAFCKEFEDMNSYFNREPSVYSKWLRDSLEESAEFAIVDLLRLSKDKIVIAEGCFPLDWMKRFVTERQCVFLIAEYNMMRADFFARQDKQDIYECIMKQNDPENTLKNVLDALMFDYFDYFEEVKASGFHYFVRTNETNLHELASEVTNCLGL